MSDHDRYVTVRLDSSHVEHLLGEDCKAGVMKPCGFSEGVMARVSDAVRRPTPAPASDAGLRAALRMVRDWSTLTTSEFWAKHTTYDDAEPYQTMRKAVEAALNAPAAVLACDRFDEMPRASCFAICGNHNGKFPAAGDNK